MLIAIPVCQKDVELVLKNLAWCDKLGAPFEHEALVTHDDGFDASAVVDAVSKRFKTVTHLTYPQWKGAQDWPMPQNWAWQHTARFIEAQKLGHWLWWEADATPVKPGWIDILSREYEASGKAFMGYLVDEHDGHMNGVACYPEAISHYTVNALICRSTAFDIMMRDDMIKNVHRANHLFHWTPSPVSFSSPESALPIAQSTAVLFHKCKDGSLIDTLRQPGLIGSIKSGVREIAKLAVSLASSPLPRPRLPMMAHLDTSSGYGIYSCSIIQELSKTLDVRVFSPSRPPAEKLPPHVARCLETTPTTDPWEFILYPCVIQPKGYTLSNHDKAYMTMWESTRLVSQSDPDRNQAVTVMNKCKVILTPSAWNATIFSSCGVETPIRIVPLGADLSEFPLSPNHCDSPILTFGTAARTNSGGVRKGFTIVLEAFFRAFPREPNVRLRIKCFPDDPPLNIRKDPRIDQIRSRISTSALAAWYRSLNVFVSGSASEGWGRHQHESMCMGRPVIGINFGGVCEFFNEENGYACDWVLSPGEGIYHTMGHYAKPTIDGLAAKMRESFEDRASIARKSALATASAHRFTLAHSAACIVKVLREFKLLPPA